MSEKQARFIPFNAVNEFLLPEYRLKIIQQVFAGLDTLPESRRSAIARMVKRSIQVFGFRNSSLAPAPLKAKAAVTTFEKSDEFAGQIMGAWCDLHPELAQKIFDFLKARGWELLPIETDRAKLPGFLTRWPAEDTFEVLDDAFTATYPGDEAHEYDINMMIAWLSGRLPVEMVEKVAEDDDSA